MKIVGAIIPILTQYFYSCRRRFIRKQKSPLTWFEHEYNLPYYDGLSGEYQDIAVMYGYVMLFAIAFPIAPAICFVTTNIEMRGDAMSMLSSRRIIPQKVPNIGAW